MSLGFVLLYFYFVGRLKSVDVFGGFAGGGGGVESCTNL